jgi:hypothetical protein
MFRKLILALGATAVIGAAAFVPTAASAHGWHHGHHWYGHYWGGGYYPIYYGSSDCYTVRQVYWNVSGKHVRRVQVCN